MTTTHKPKHRRIESFGGSTPKGPERWMRAAHNAFTHPNSKAAKLFMDRVTMAHRLRTEFARGEKQPAQFFEYTTAWDSYYRVVEVKEVSQKRRYYTCSLYCTAMQVQLDFGVKTYEQLVNFLSEDPRANMLLPSTLKRPVRCQCCGSTIK